MITELLLLTSSIVQIVALGVAIRIWRQAPLASTWALVALVVSLMAVRRLAALIAVTRGDGNLSLGSEMIGLIISCAVLVTLIRLGPVIVRMTATQQKAQIGEDLYESLFESAAVGVATALPNGKILTANPALAAMLGYTVDELTGMNFADFTHPDDVPHEINLIRAAWAERVPHYTFEKRYIRPDGSVFWVHLTASLLREADGAPRAVLGVVVDISARRAAEDRLREQWAFTRRVLDTVPNQIFVKDAAGRFQLVNQAAAARYGLTPDQMIGKCPHEINPDRRQTDRFAEQDRIALAQEAPLELTWQLPHEKPTNKDLWHHVIKMRIMSPDGTEPMVLGVVSDITELKAAQERLAHSEAMNRAIIDAIPDLLFRLDHEGHCVDMHAPQPGLLAMPRETIIGSVLTEAGPPQLAAVIRDMQANVRGPGDVYAVEYALDTPIGHRDFEARVVRMPLDEMLAIVRDITERKQAEAVAVRLAVEQERSRILAEFIRDTVHEFATPISIIRSGLYLVQHVEDDRRLRHFERMEAQLDYIERLVQGMTLMARLDQHMDRDHAPVALGPLLESLSSIYHSLAEQRGLTFVREWDSPLPTLMGDAHYLRVALEKLLDNAIAYTPAPGTITLRCGSNHHQIVIAVQDTGIGIAPEHHASVFNRFFRVDMQRTHRGAGLGLSIARRVIEAHGGGIELESAPGEGSTFSVRLPFETDTPPV